jgi:hypothetical protein
MHHFIIMSSMIGASPVDQLLLNVPNVIAVRRWLRMSIFAGTFTFVSLGCEGERGRGG